MALEKLPHVRRSFSGTEGSERADDGRNALERAELGDQPIPLAFTNAQVASRCSRRPIICASRLPVSWLRTADDRAKIPRAAASCGSRNHGSALRKR